METEARRYLYRGKVLRVEAREAVNHVVYGAHFTKSVESLHDRVSALEKDLKYIVEDIESQSQEVV